MSFGKLIVSMGVLILLFLSMYLIYQSRYNGIWEMYGYGLTFRINYGFLKTFEVTESYYTKESTYNGLVVGNTLFSGLGKFKVIQSGDQLQLVDLSAHITYTLLKKEITYFESKREVESGMQIEKFEMFYEMFKENYAFESLYGAHLDENYLSLKALVTKGISDRELFNHMSTLVADFKDGHISVDWNDESFCPIEYVPKWISDKDQLNALSKVITEKYVSDYKKIEDAPIRYGLLTDEIGIIVIHGMGVEALDKSGSTKKAMDEIIQGFNEKGIKKIAIELRFNNGGFDETSLCIAGYFTDMKHSAYKKQAYVKGAYTPLQEVYVMPQNVYFGGEVYILTSGFTMSAAETFTRAMLANPKNKVTVVGEQTAGFYSDAFSRSLPDGFSYSLSNELYFTPNDDMIEGQGILPNIIIPVSMLKVYEGKENALDWIVGN